MDTISLDTWLQPPDNRQSLHEVERLVETATISRGHGEARPLGGVPRGDSTPNPRLTIGEGRELALDDFLRLTHTDAIVVLRGEEIVFERYFDENTAESRHIVMSVSKSLCGMLAGILIDGGALDPGATTSFYVPELAEGSYGESTVGQLLDMTAAPHFDMTYTNPFSEVQAGDRSANWRPRIDSDADGTREFLQTLVGAGEHGSGFQYCSATTDVLAWVLERAANMPYVRLLERMIWSRIGAEDDAVITIDNHGTPYACAGLNMRLRDLARFGRVVLDGGRFAGEQVIPEDWIAATAGGGAFDTADASDRAHGSYKNQWWVPADGRGSFYAAGIFGQYLWVDPATDVTIAKFSSEPDPLAHSTEHVAAFRSLSSAAASWSTVTTRQKDAKDDH